MGLLKVMERLKQSGLLSKAKSRWFRGASKVMSLRYITGKDTATKEQANDDLMRKVSGITGKMNQLLSRANEEEKPRERSPRR